MASSREQLKQYCLQVLGNNFNEDLNVFVNQLSANKYSKWYLDIIGCALSRRLSKKSDQYVEGHHVIPVSISGKPRSQGQKVFLTAREHFVCHRLLVYMLDGDHKHKMQFALSRLVTGNKKNYCKSSRVYEYVKKMNSVASSKRSKQYWEKIPLEVRSQMRTGSNNGRYNKPVSAETRLKISEANKGRLAGEKHPLWGAGHSEETKQKMSQEAKASGRSAGVNNPNYGKQGAAFGKKWYHNPNTDETRYFIPGTEPDGFVLGRK